MIIPVHTYPVCIDFTAFMRLLEEKHGWSYHDMAGCYSKEAQAEREASRDAWLEENGYSGKAYVLDKPSPDSSDWPKDSPEMALRIEINNKLRDVEEQWSRPYQNVWHWFTGGPWSELNRGGVNYLHKDWLDYPDGYGQTTPDYVLTVLKAIFDEVEDHPAFDGESITFHVDW